MLNKERALYIGIILFMVIGFCSFLHKEGYWEKKREIRLTKAVESIAANAVDIDYETTSLSLLHKSIEIKKDASEGFFDLAIIKDGDKVETIAEGHNILFEKVFPSVSTPEIVILSNHQGGNCCEPTPTFIDLQPEKTFISEPVYDMASVSMRMVQKTKDSYHFSGLSVFPINVLGDYAMLTLAYDRPTQALHYLPIEGKDDLSALIGAHPSSLFMNESSRGMLLSKLSEKNFSRVRTFFDVGSHTTLSQYRYILGDGLMPHSGGSEEGRYIVDLITNNWLLITLSDGMSKMNCYMVADNDDIAASLILEMADAYALNSEDIGQCSE